jgi:hypothetical protein
MQRARSSSTDRWRCVRAGCAGAAAKAPTQRAARRNRRRMWCLGLPARGCGLRGGLTPKEAAAAAATEARLDVLDTVVMRQ